MKQKNFLHPGVTVTVNNRVCYSSASPVYLGDPVDINSDENTKLRRFADQLRPELSAHTYTPYEEYVNYLLHMEAQTTLGQNCCWEAPRPLTW